MKETVSGTCTTKLWQKDEYSRVDGGPDLVVAEKESTFEGGIQGESVVRYSFVQMRDGSKPFAGHMRISGRIGDRVGSFVVEDNGTSGPRGSNSTWKIVAGSASGDLVGLSGEGTWEWEKGKSYETYTLSYEFSEQ